jgi:hypothetical protein
MARIDENALRRLALQLAVQLPANRDEALAVLELTRSFVDDFLMPEAKEMAALRDCALRD